MPYYVPLPDGRDVEFPDDFPRADAMRRAREIYFGETRRAPEEQAPPPDNRSIGGLFTSGVRRGVRELGVLGGDILPGMIGRGLGFDEFADRQFREARETKEDIERTNPARYGSYEDVRGVRDALGYVAESVGEGLPSIIASLVPGGIGAAVGARAAGAGATALARQAAIRQGAVIGSGVGAAGQNFPDSYQSIMENTGREAMGPALVAGAINTALDTVLPAYLAQRIPEGLRGRIVGDIGRRLGLGAAIGFGAEAGTEGTQEAVNAAAEAFVDETRPFWNDRNFTRIVDASIRGGLVGGTVGAASEAAFGQSPEAAARKDAEERARRDQELLQALEVMREDARAYAADLPLALGQRRIDTPLGALSVQEVVEYAANSSNQNMLAALASDISDTDKVDTIVRLMRGETGGRPVDGPRVEPGADLRVPDPESGGTGRVLTAEQTRTQGEAAPAFRIAEARRQRTEDAPQDPRLTPTLPRGEQDFQEVFIVADGDRQVPVAVAGFARVPEINAEGEEVLVERPLAVEIDPRTAQPIEGAEPIQLTDEMVKSARSVLYPRPGLTPRAAQEFMDASRTTRAQSRERMTLAEATNQARATDRSGTNSSVPPGPAGSFTQLGSPTIDRQVPGQADGDPRAERETTIPTLGGEYGREGRSPRFRGPEADDGTMPRQRADLRAALQEARDAQGDDIPLIDDFVPDRVFFGRAAQTTTPVRREAPQRVSREDRQQTSVPGGGDEVLPPGTHRARGVFEFDPNAITAEPEVFQFKADTDDDGVSERLRGIKQWDPDRSGLAVVYEYADGRRSIADGHQRLGLAKRLMSNGITTDKNGDPIRVRARLFREVDGVTPTDARVYAALKNIAEGSGTAIDAAKVMRDTGMAPEEMNLPPNSAIVQQALGLKELGNVAFGYVVNKQVEPIYAAQVGRFIKEPGKQEEALRLMARRPPSNVDVAESIARQIADTDSQQNNLNLFDEGDGPTIVELRAEVMARALAEIRRGKTVFGTLTRRADIAEGAGNKLDRQSNKKRLEDSRRLEAVLQAEANKRGPLSDALTAAAQFIERDGIQRAAERFLNDAATLQGTLERGADRRSDQPAAGGEGGSAAARDGSEQDGRIDDANQSGLTFSSRAAAGTTDKPAPPASPDRAALRERAVKVIQDRLDALRKMGKQGEKAAEAVEAALASGRFTPIQLVGAFRIAERAAGLLGDRQLEVKFLSAPYLEGGMARDGSVKGITPDGVTGLMTFSLADAVLPYAGETTAHEALHVAQALFAASDRQVFEMLRRAFPADKGLAGIDQTIQRRLKALAAPPPAGRQADLRDGRFANLYDYLDAVWNGMAAREGALPENANQRSLELQAYVFGALDDARRNGRSLVGITPGILRFANFFGNLRQRLGNALRGDGFRSVDDVLTGISDRGISPSLARADMDALGATAFATRKSAGAPTIRDDTRQNQMPGMEGTDRQAIKAREEARLKGKVPQKGTEDLDLFSDDYKQGKLFSSRVASTTASDIAGKQFQVMYGRTADAIQKGFSKLPLLGQKPDGKLADDLIIRMQDRMLPVGRMVDDVRKAGGKVSDATDAYMAEELYHGRTAVLLEDRAKGLYKPIFEAMKAQGVERGDLEDFLYARHAMERNAYIRSINEDPTKGSGMTDAEAAEVMRRLIPKRPQLERVAALVDAVVADTNKTRFDAGLIPDFKKVKAEGKPVPNYRYYVPLRGFADETLFADEGVEAIKARTGSGFKIKGREDQRSLGRQSRAGNILEHVILQNEEAVIRAEKNRVGQAFLNLVRDNPDIFGDTVKILPKAPVSPRLVNGTVRLAPDPLYKNRDDVLVVKEGGQEVPIQINDPRIARAMTGASGLGSENVSKVFKGLATFNRYLSQVNTAWNPEFVITNFVRDLQTAGVNIQQFEVNGLASKIMKDVPSSLRAVRTALREKGNGDPRWVKAYEDFRRAGGKSEYLGLRDLDATLDKVAEELRTEPDSKTKGAFKAVVKFIEDYNSVVENGIRVATFENLRQMGVSDERAAQVAKNLTVNFNKAGENRVILNSLYLFYNASIQGSMAMANAIARSSRVRKIVAGIVVAGLVQDVVNSIASGDDDDEKKTYDKIPRYVLEHNFVLMDPMGLTDRGYFAFPMPYGFNAFYNLGRTLGRAARGGYSPMEAASSGLMTFVDAFNPIGGTENFFNFMAPTVLDPLVSLGLNRDFADRPIVPGDRGFGPPKPESQRYWNTTAAPYVAVSEWLNTLTGGSNIVPGVVDISPNVIAFLVNYATGGAGAFMERTYQSLTDTMPNAFRGDLEELDVRTVPFARKLYGNVTTRNDLERFIENTNDVLRVRREMQEAQRYGQAERVQSVIENHPRELAIAEEMSRLVNQRNRLATQLNRIQRDPNLDDATKREILRNIRREQDMIVGVANRLYNQQVAR